MSSVPQCDEFWGRLQPRTDNDSSIPIRPSHYHFHKRQYAKAFGEISDATAITVLDISRMPAEGQDPNDIHREERKTSLTKTRLTNTQEALKFLKAPIAVPTRFISICSINSIRPLALPNDILCLLYQQFGVHTELLDLILSFGRKPKNCDAGAGVMTIKRTTSRVVETQYLVAFPEAIQGPISTAWTLRQVGVYHRYNEAEDESLWLMFHAKPESDIQKAIESDVNGRQNILQVHLLVFASHLKSWRWYLEHLNVQFDALVNIVVTIDFTEPEAYRTGSDLLQKLQHFEDVILPLVPRLKASLATIRKIYNLRKAIPKSRLCAFEGHTTLMDEITSFETQIHGYIASTELLKERSHRTLDILAAGLNLRNQTRGLGFSHTMLNLTKDTVEDSATVRVVTIVTLIYLPASFVSSLLGTNLFAFQSSEGSGFQVSKQFWIFLVISIPLTMLTIGSWLFYSRRRANLARTRFQRISTEDYAKMC